MEQDDVNQGRAPVIDRGARSGSIGLLVALALSFVAAAAVLAVVKPEEAAPYVQVILGLLAVVGVFALFAGAIGLVRFGAKPQGPTLSGVFLDGFPEGVVVTDDQGRIIYTNPAYAALTRAETANDLRTIERIFAANPEVGEEMFRLCESVRGRVTAETELRTRTPIGSEEGGARWYHIRVDPLASASDREGGDRLTSWRIVDVTRERERQESSFQELQQVVTFLDHAPAGFFSADAGGRLTYLNATLADWLGWDLAKFEAGAIRLKDIVQGQGMALILDAAADGRTRVLDLDLVKRNGQSLPVRLLHKVPMGPGGKPGDSRTLVINRSSGEDASEALRAAEVRFQRFFNNTPIAIAALGRDGAIGQTNASFLELFGGMVREDANGVRGSLIDTVIPTDRPKLAEALAAALAGQGDIEPVDAQLIDDSVKKRSARFFVSSVEEGTGDGEAAIVYALETTEQQELEQRFAQSQKMQAIGQLAGGIAHDFNNVLTAIIGFSDLLLASHRPTDPSFQDIMNIKQNANRAAALVRQLLAFSRRQTLRPEVIQFGDTLADLHMLLGRLLGEKVGLEVVHGRDLWPIRADTSQLEQVIVNLAVNARDAMPNGGRVTIATRNVGADEKLPYKTPGMPAADYVLIEVSDTGTGIPPEIIENIFEPFFTTKPVGQGTGLGLSTVYGIVKQTGGFVYCSSEMGRGTTFHILLPRHVETAAEAAKAAESSKAEQPQAAGADLTGSATILLVEDEEAVRAFASRALASRGYTVHEAGTGTEALQVMEETGGAIDLVVSDVVMPEMDGPSLLRELRKARPDLKIIFVSGYAEDAFAKNLPEGESFSFLPKPFTLKALATAVKDALGR
ncbi:cell cycle histidine kinase CckA [Pinisolibacter aquiterrae]|uniref:cell cycle histidine kinase CckA n=1 Tax=Pinisolibacter aquiterrae TaxID=2815579 RepID=UPI001C3CB59B|nr:PAS domain-containing sensor histidine kinase [Pinisolibacter aquiterrae]MBV5265333.1 response regulator [Pinisolibacter aquiterrae]MCC8235340.1 response regulator [Pinisolibacter aquiterrae]